MKYILILLLSFASLAASAQIDFDTVATQKRTKYWNLKNGAKLDFNGTGGIVPPRGNTSERPAVDSAGTIRFNRDSFSLEVWNGVQWRILDPGTLAQRINREYVTWNAITDQAQVYNSNKGIKRISGSGTVENFSTEKLGKGQALVWKATARDDNNMRIGIHPSQSGGISTIEYVAIQNFNMSAERVGVSEGYSGPTVVNGEYWRIAFKSDNNIQLEQSADGSTWTLKHNFSGTDPGDSDEFYAVFYGAAPGFGTDEIFIMNIL